jgi:hypothetical protein
MVVCRFRATQTHLLSMFATHSVIWYQRKSAFCSKLSVTNYFRMRRMGSDVYITCTELKANTHDSSSVARNRTCLSFVVFLPPCVSSFMAAFFLFVGVLAL